ncbi:MAG: helix-turn-helix domain-containing protein [Actinomycetota bacterium]
MGAAAADQHLGAFLLAQIEVGSDLGDWRATRGNLSAAARRLGISRQTLYRKLRKN